MPPGIVRRIATLTIAIVLLLFLSLSLGAQTLRAEADYSVVSTIKIGCGLLHDTIDPNTNLIYAVDLGCGGKLYMVNATTGATVASVKVGFIPDSVGVNPVTNMIYVSNQNNDTISVINGTTFSVTDTINLGSVAQNPDDVAVNPSTNEIFVTSSYSNSITSGILSIINGSNNQIILSMIIKGVPNAVAVDSSTNMIWVANVDGSITSINGTTDNVTDTLNLGSGQYTAFGIAVDPNSETVYVSGFSSSLPTGTNVTDILWEVNAKNDVEIGSVTQIGPYPTLVALNPRTNIVYVANQLSLVIYNGTTLNTIQSLTNISGPVDVAVDPSTNVAYVTIDGGIAVIASQATNNSSTSTNYSSWNSTTLSKSTTSNSSSTISPSNITSMTSMNSTGISTSTSSLENNLTSGSVSQLNAPPPQGGNSPGGSFFMESVIALGVAAVSIAGIAGYVIRKHE